ncbi:MAG: twin-arginine translocase subunit TatC [Rhodobacteraceae bacterium]|nr:twin-arginine translocase subunit TatC [Paracoccaceae bacterium]MCY4139170.1 twin-arginine translocase subunit TatC [Paracoccaceae bacterium]
MSEEDINASAAPLIEHLAELRTRLIRSVLAFVAGMLICFAFSETLLDFLVEPIAEILRSRGQDPQLIFTAPQEKFFVLFRISVVMGLGLSFPVIAHQLWRFVAPGLYRNEKRAFLPFIIASPALFLAGAAFTHYIVTPLAMNFFIGFSDVIPTITEILSNSSGGLVVPVERPDPDSELSTVFLGSVRESLDITLKFIFAFGICFQLPVLMTLLGMAELVSAEGMKRMRKYAVVGILCLAAVITPPDVITQVILFTAVYALYEVSIQLVATVERRRIARLRAAGLYDEEDDSDAEKIL